MKYADRMALPKDKRSGRRLEQLEAKSRERPLTVARYWDEATHQWLPTGQQRVDSNRGKRKADARLRKEARRAWARKWNPNRGPRATPEQRAEVKAMREAQP